MFFKPIQLLIFFQNKHVNYLSPKDDEKPGQNFDDIKKNISNPLSPKK